MQPMTGDAIIVEQQEAPVAQNVIAEEPKTEDKQEEPKAEAKPAEEAKVEAKPAEEAKK